MPVISLTAVFPLCVRYCVVVLLQVRRGMGSADRDGHLLWRLVKVRAIDADTDALTLSLYHMTYRQEYFLAGT